MLDNILFTQARPGEHLWIGQLGYLLSILSFALAALAAFSYWKAERHRLTEAGSAWLNLGRRAFWGHSLAVVGHWGYAVLHHPQPLV